MDFLYKLYSNQYFALILFSVIAVLLVLFIIVLIAAMKDAKKRKLEISNSEESTEAQKVEDNASIEEAVSSEETFAFTEESKEIELEAPQTDITLDEPDNENSMNDLLNEFEKPEIDLHDVENDLDALIAKVSLNENENAKKVEESSLNEDFDLDEDFELPAIKKIEDVEEIADDNLKEDKVEEPEKVEENKEEVKEINLEGTGVLNFSNVETESYEIKK